MSLFYEIDHNLSGCRGNLDKNRSIASLSKVKPDFFDIFIFISLNSRIVVANKLKFKKLTFCYLTNYKQVYFILFFIFLP